MPNGDLILFLSRSSGISYFCQAISTIFDQYRADERTIANYSMIHILLLNANILFMYCLVCGSIHFLFFNTNLDLRFIDL
jgi:hypothetical protein